MLLTIDVGNTNTVLGIFDGTELVKSWRVKTDPRDTADELWIRISTLLDGYIVDSLAICSTVPASLREYLLIYSILRSSINSFCSLVKFINY